MDLAPTFIELAGGTVPVEMDGRSFARVLTSGGAAPSPRDTVLIEYESIRAQPTDDNAVNASWPRPLYELEMPRHPHDGPNNTYRC